MTRRTSLRARAQRIYRARAAAKPPAAPTPETKAKPTRLTARVRRLYENSAVPVREIAQLAGVTERTSYKYARKGGWTPRYAWNDAGGAHRRKRWRATERFAPTKGAGGRFIARVDKGKPYRQGLKATDAQGARRAIEKCAKAERIARAVQAEAEAEQRCAALVRAIDNTNGALRELNVYLTARRKSGAVRHARADALIESALYRAVAVTTCSWEALLEAEEAPQEQNT
jgi:hypothetical protein